MPGSPTDARPRNTPTLMSPRARRGCAGISCHVPGSYSVLPAGRGGLGGFIPPVHSGSLRASEKSHGETFMCRQKMKMGKEGRR